jgi:hypothetical protein
VHLLGFLASLHLGIAPQLLVVHRRMRERVWEAAYVQLATITLDNDTTVVRTARCSSAQFGKSAKRFPKACPVPLNSPLAGLPRNMLTIGRDRDRVQAVMPAN